MEGRDRSGVVTLRALVLKMIAYLAGVLLLVTAYSQAAVAAGRHAGNVRRRIILPYDKGGAFWQGDLWSPDRKYIASAKLEEAGSLSVTVIDAKSHQNLVRAEDVNGFVWVPHGPHRLVAAACGLYGRAFLAVWDGGARWRSLQRARWPDRECFELHGVTDDGRFIVYGYAPNLGATGGTVGRQLKRKHWLALPSR
jgi:hypothetical protein